MAKRFKLRISRLIPSFQSCRSKDPSDLPSSPVPCSSSAFHRLPSSVENIHSHQNQLPPPKPQRISIKRYVSTSLTCGFRRPRLAQSTPTTIHHKVSSPPLSPPPTASPTTPHFKWGKEDEWHVIAKIHDRNRDNKINMSKSNSTPAGGRKTYNTAASAQSSSSDTEVIIPPPSLLPPRSKRRSRRNKNTTRRQSLNQLIRLSTSSADSGLFFSEEEFEFEKENELETLVCSSRSFSTTATDSSTEFSPHLETIREGPTSAPSRSTRKRRSVRKKVKRVKQGVLGKKRGLSGNAGFNYRRSTSSDEGMNTSSPARLSVFKKIMPCGVVEGKVRESFAIVKKTEDPHGEFKRSMMEMVIEKEMFEESELEKLLQCFLSLNSRDHHQAIVEAFAEIWKEVFCKSDVEN